MKKTLFFGGAFNPLTLAHIHLVDEVRKSLGYEYVIFVPSKSKYILHTEGKSFSYTEKERFDMLKATAKHYPWMIISDIEIKEKEQSRTYFTLRKLKEEGYDLKLLMGSDWLEGLESKWLYIDEILKEFGIIVMKRNHDDISSIINKSDYLKKRKEQFLFIDTPEIYQNISSSKIRALLEENKLAEVKPFVPQEILPWLERKRVKMKNTYLEVGCLIPSLKIGDPKYNASSIIEMIKKNQDLSLLVFPELCLTGYTCQDLFFQEALLDEAKKELSRIAEATLGLNNTVVVGLPIRFKNKLYNVAAYLSNGRILGIVPKIHMPTYGEFYESRWFASGKDIFSETLETSRFICPFGCNLLFVDHETNAIISTEICEDMWVVNKPSRDAILAGANIIVNPSASNEIIGKKEYRRKMVTLASGEGYCTYLYASSNMNESSQDLVFSGHCMIANNGRLLNEMIFPEENSVIKAIVDLEENSYNRLHQSTFVNEGNENYDYISTHCKPMGGKRDITPEEVTSLLKDKNYSISRMPFVPEDDLARKERCQDILTIQAHGLATRIKNTGIKKLVIGISGGLDSTLALLVCHEASKIVKGVEIIGYTMPNEGNTSSLTYTNSINLMKSLGIEPKVAPIGEGVKLHLKQIGHPETYQGEGDTAYENAQARMRTYILMDVANYIGGLVVGTGDLSELALGWCTYNGDHMSMYGVNTSIPKTLVQYIVRTYALTMANEELKKTLLSILDTPISPELTPSMNGKIAQKTEEKIGKYDLNDFFMFYLLRYGFRPSKIFALASLAYPEVDKESLKNSMLRFYSRFFSQQFKRSCLPDGPKVGSLTLSPRGDYRMPSDATASLYLEEIKSL